MDPNASDNDQQQQLYYPPHIIVNQSRIYSTKFLTACFAGAAAGILGLENFRGFAVFVFAILLSSALLWLRCKGLPKKYVPGGWMELVNPGQENLFSFLLAWTLFYGSLSSLNFYCHRMLTCPSGIVHGEIKSLVPLARMPDTYDDLKCMTSQFWMPFGCSSPIVDAVFLHGLYRPAWSPPCREWLSVQVPSTPSKGEIKVCRIGMPANLHDSFQATYRALESFLCRRRKERTCAQQRAGGNQPQQRHWSRSDGHSAFPDLVLSQHAL